MGEPGSQAVPGTCLGLRAPGPQQPYLQPPLTNTGNRGTDRLVHCKGPGGGHRRTASQVGSVPSPSPRLPPLLFPRRALPTGRGTVCSDTATLPRTEQAGRELWRWRSRGVRGPCWPHPQHTPGPSPRSCTSPGRCTYSHRQHPTGRQGHPQSLKPRPEQGRHLLAEWRPCERTARQRAERQSAGPCANQGGPRPCSLQMGTRSAWLGCHVPVLGHLPRPLLSHFCSLSHVPLRRRPCHTCDSFRVPTAATYPLRLPLTNTHRTTQCAALMCWCPPGTAEPTEKPS